MLSAEPGFAFAQPRQRLLVGGDIGIGADPAKNVARRVANGAAAGHQPMEAAVGKRQAPLVLVDCARRLRGIPCLLGPLHVFRHHAGKPRLADRLGDRTAGELGPAIVHIFDDARRIRLPDDLRHEIGKLAVALLAFAEPLLHGLALGDVEIDPEDASSIGLVRSDNGAALHPSNAPVGTAKPELDDEARPFGRRLFLGPDRDQTLPVVRVGEIEEGVEGRFDGALGHADLEIAARRPFDAAGPEVVVPRRSFGTLEGDLQSQNGARKGVLRAVPRLASSGHLRQDRERSSLPFPVASDTDRFSRSRRRILLGRDQNVADRAPPFENECGRRPLQPMHGEAGGDADVSLDHPAASEDETGEW